MKEVFRYHTIRFGQRLRHFFLGCHEGRTRLWEIHAKPDKLSAHMVEIKPPDSEWIIHRLNKH